MNYKKIEWIFLVSFFLLNIYLGINIYNEQKVSSNSVDAKEEIEEVLKRNGIHLETSLTAKAQRACYIQAESQLLNGKQLAYSQQTKKNHLLFVQIQPAFSVHKGEIRENIQNFMQNKHNVCDANAYQYFPYTNDAKQVIYAQTYHNLAFAEQEGQLRFFLKSENGTQKIIRYEQGKLKNIQALRSDVPLITDKEAVYTLFLNNKLVHNDTIQWLALTYSKIYQEGKIGVYVPTWLVSVKSKSKVEELYKVNAITSHVISNSEAGVRNAS